MRNEFVVSVALALAGFSAWPNEAHAWEWFRSENRDVRAGNERLARNAPAEALPHYDSAARSLPSEAGVHLNRGIALLSSEQYEQARTALRMATERTASREVRARAHYNMGLAFYREADRAAQAAGGGAGAQLAPSGNGAPSGAPNAQSGGDPREAQRLLREARDAFRNALRQQPGYESAAWNLEITERRLREEEERQRQREEQEQQEQQNQGQQDQNQGQQGQDQGEQSQNQQNQGQQQPGDGQDNAQEQPGQNQQQDQDGDNADRRQDQRPQGNGAQQDPGQSGQDDQPGNQPPATGTEQAMPQDMRRVLDALEGGEQNLERARARARAQREMRRPRQDW